MRHLIHSTFAPRQSMPSQQGSSPQALGRPPRARLPVGSTISRREMHKERGQRRPAGHFPSPPGPLSHRASLGRGGASGAPHTSNAPPTTPLSDSGRGGASGVSGAYTTSHNLTHFSQLPSRFPSPPGPLSHGASLGREEASGVPVAYTTNCASRIPPSSPLPASGRGVAKPG